MESTEQWSNRELYSHMLLKHTHKGLPSQDYIRAS